MDEPGGISIVTNISSPTVIKGSAGRIALIMQLGNMGGTFHDCATTGAANSSNEVFKVPAAFSLLLLQIPCSTGIVFVPATVVPPSQVAKFAVSYT